MVKEHIKPLHIFDEETHLERNLVVHNDDVNTFSYVISTLMEVCGHDANQAEQCTLIIHYNGKCAVKKGSFSELKPMCLEILERGINATID